MYLTAAPRTSPGANLSPTGDRAAIMHRTFALYGLPDFDDRQRLTYLSLSGPALPRPRTTDVAATACNMCGFLAQGNRISE